MDFMILNMAEDVHNQIILGRPFLSIVGFKIDVKEERLTFDMKEQHADYVLFKDQDCSHSLLFLIVDFMCSFMIKLWS